MSSDFPNSGEKRSRSPSNEANNSFVKNVTSRVSGLLPATITKWFSSPSSSNANGSAPTAEATDSSTEDEGPDNPEAAEPPSKRMRFQSSGGFNHYGAETNCIPSNAEIMHVIEPVTPYGTVQSPPGRTTFRRETNYVSTPMSNRSPEDTLDRIEPESSMFKSQHTVSTIGPSVATKRKSLFDSPSEISIRSCAKTACNTMKDPNQPCFKPSLLGSPFYPGRTMYGGSSTAYINTPNIRHQKTAQVNESSTVDNTISQSTRRIMDLLEHYSSPLNEAKRIPQYSRKPRNESVQSGVSSEPANKIVSYKTQELHVPSIATILRLKQRSRLMESTSAARQLIASHSSTADFAPYPTLPPTAHREKQPAEEPSNNINKLTTKVKTKLTRTRGQNDYETELPTPVNLPSATLQIDRNNLPKFSFGIVEPAKPTQTVPEKRDAPKLETKLSTPETNTTSSYKFSSPVKLSTDESQSTSTPPKFTFGSPERTVDKISENKDVSCVLGTKEPKKSTAEWKCPDCWVSNNEDAEKCVCCGFCKPNNSKKTTKCTVCKLADGQPNEGKCVNCEKIPNNIGTLKPLKVDSAKWKCEDCWVQNDDAVEKCACCGASKPNKEPKHNEIVNNVDPEWKCDDCWVKNKSALEKCAACGGAKPGVKNVPTTFKIPTTDNEWKCDDCWVKNKGDLDKCAACGNAKAGAKPGPTSFFNTPIKTDNTFKTILKMQTNKWECPNCLVRNDSDKSKCACCDADKPGTVNKTEKGFNFGVNANTSFKFGIDPKAQTETKPVEVKPVESKTEEETNNNVLPKTPSFSFGVPKKVEEAPKKAEDKTDGAPTVNFSFGIPKTAAMTTSAPVVTTAPALPIFGIPKPTEPKPIDEEKERPQEVPKVDLNLPKETSKPTPNLFATPHISASDKPSVTPFAPEKNPTVTATFVLNSSGGLTEKKDSVAAVNTSKETTPKPTFTFGSAGLTPSTNLFATTATKTAISFGPAAQSTPNNTDSMFKKIEAPTTTPSLPTNLFASPKTDAQNSVSLFQKSETQTTTSAPPALGAVAPLFGFGNAQQTDKPKFNFSFGSTTKTDAPSMFKPTFGTSSENKFALAGNTLGGNGLSSNVGITNSGTEISNNTPNTGLFGTAQKENMWSNNNASNLFTSNTNSTTNAMQKPAAFTFGSSTPFNAGTNAQTFGTNTASNVFGMGGNNNSSASLFAQPTQPSANVFGSPQTASNPAPSLFGTPSAGATPTFGASNPSIPSFEAPSLTPAPAPAFNFGTPQTTNVFGFGGQQQQQPPQQPYNFGGAQAGPLQFNMGSQPSAPPPRRVCRAIRRKTPR